MRDPNRIKPFLEKFEELWNLSPDKRFGQLVYCLLPKDNDGFYIEDDVFEKLIDDKLNKNIRV